MHIDEVYTYCLAKKNAKESMPFGEKAVVFKLYDKMFALLSISEENPFINLKCAPDWALELRDKYRSIEGGYHMNKKHWNTVYLIGDVSDDILVGLIDHSYATIFKNLPSRFKNNLA